MAANPEAALLQRAPACTSGDLVTFLRLAEIDGSTRSGEAHARAPRVLGGSVLVAGLLAVRFYGRLASDNDVKHRWLGSSGLHQLAGTTRNCLLGRPSEQACAAALHENPHSAALVGGLYLEAWDIQNLSSRVTPETS